MSYALSEISRPEEFTAWDTFVAQHPDGSFAQLSGWANLKQQFEWQSHILVVKDKDKIIAGAVMLDRSGLLGKKVSYVPYGPLVDESHQKALASLIEGLIQESKESVVLRLEPHLTIKDDQVKSWQESLKKYSFNSSQRFLQPEATLVLDLTQTEEELMAGMRQTTRRYIRQAERAGLSVVSDDTGSRLKEFYNVLQQVDQRRQFGIHTLEYYRAAWNSLNGRMAGWQESAVQQSSSPAAQQTLPLIQPYLFFVQQDNQVLGAYFMVRAGNKSWELYGGVGEEGMKLKANYYLKWQAIIAMKQDGVTQYDQWGVAPLTRLSQSQKMEDKDQSIYDKSHHLAGVTYFKEGFGGERVAYVGSYDHVNQPVFYSLAQALRKL